MREIKFRAWDKKNNCWYKPIYEAYKGRLEDISLSPSGDISMRTFKKGTRIEETIHESRFPNRFILMQFTGLKDKNGKEIYEGDIVKYRTEDTQEFIEEVVFENGAFDPVSQEVTDLDQHWIVSDFEIIGNIYENPELLE